MTPASAMCDRGPPPLRPSGPPATFDQLDDLRSRPDPPPETEVVPPMDGGRSVADGGRAAGADDVSGLNCSIGLLASSAGPVSSSRSDGRCREGAARHVSESSVSSPSFARSLNAARASSAHSNTRPFS